MDFSSTLYTLRRASWSDRETVFPSEFLVMKRGIEKSKTWKKKQESFKYSSLFCSWSTTINSWPLSYSDIHLVTLSRVQTHTTCYLNNCIWSLNCPTLSKFCLIQLSFPGYLFMLILWYSIGMISFFEDIYSIHLYIPCIYLVLIHYTIHIPSYLNGSLPGTWGSQFSPARSCECTCSPHCRK